ncbi:MAG: membrane protein insertion efficiency factor YidD [Candidatus Nealsonbacteria bacterium RIFOXYB1_FULL_40_15]|uniref:Putative membrane protein insertion efficiency factor n=2 Tax=Candidatus Nealsoniibacteriota TaxID=1817911 RepID=A0A1G2ET67_9BACT|nr:MAG: membrane protein insertion efficiency factor YidD [Candidatus Nealsonbacteria bacterium RIFOXYB1_FULL_40_15]OGZ28712.1 MAG: membrane protein insertion efficiency factor YidD [Candidatus Nealsonbacteria bacterium RIFOXYC1_FULL_40_7]OGZ29171.1 MAG: membrane protein insertion efficiency factor YidD [Candidatus Nealsonbacteria bacterium RIFOXYD1_FULL_39_11]
MKKILTQAIKIYQAAVSPLLGHNCRFYPTCSEYCIISIEKYGAKGLLKCAARVARCNPWNKGGADLP